ncbi:hypothetical protein D3C71_1898210 [compost metagenome]
MIALAFAVSAVARRFCSVTIAASAAVLLPVTVAARAVRAVTSALSAAIRAWRSL